MFPEKADDKTPEKEWSCPNITISAAPAILVIFIVEAPSFKRKSAI
jgi:hypothetical protein